MRITLQPAAIWLLTFITFFSCDKKSNPVTPPTQTSTQKMELLTAGKWYKTAEGLDTDRDGVVNAPSDHFQEPCNQDDAALFSSDGTLTWFEGPTKCNPTAPDTYPLAWHFTADGINMLGKDLKIFVLNDKQFTVYYEQVNAGNTEWQLMSFKH